jgi:hypothetical protein
VTPRRLRTLTQLLTLAGIAAVIAGPLYLANGLTQVGGPVRVPVVFVPPTVNPVPVARIPVPGLPDNAVVTADDGRAVLSAWGATFVEKLLERSDDAIRGLCVGAGALLLRPVLKSLASGHLFSDRHSRRMAALIVVVVIGWMLAPLLPQLGATVVLERLGLAGPNAEFTVSLMPPLWPLLLVAALLLLAETFRQGEQRYQHAR